MADRGRVDQFSLARRALAGAPDLIVIDEARTIDAALAAGVDVVRLYDDLTAADRKTLFPRNRPPEMFAVARLPRTMTNKAIAQRSGDLFALDGVHGPGNIGAIIRTAAAFGVGAVVALDGRRRDLSRRGTIRAAGPAMFRVPVLTMTLEELVGFCDRNEIVIAVTSPRSGTPPGADERRLAIVLGSETTGCRPDTTSNAKLQIRVATTDQVESLNVSAAAAVIAYERSRPPPPVPGPRRDALRGDTT